MTNKKPRSNIGKRNRNKGNNFERQLAKLLREYGYKYCKTSRQASRLLDDCKIDISGINMIIQAKAGYKRARPKYDVIFREIKKCIKDNFPPNHTIHNLPIILVHKMDGRKQENWTWTFNHEDVKELILPNLIKTLNEQNRGVL